jgi:hypothetical protein
MTKTLLRKTFVAFALAGALAAAASTGAQAKPFPHPHGHGWGPALGIGLGLGLLGAAVAASEAAPTCHVESRYDDYGNYIGRVRICD